jgi:N-methylhydantoinase A
VKRWLVGIDTGGTFTDLVAFCPDEPVLRLAKVPSVPEDPSRAVMAALEDLFDQGVAPEEIQVLVHGTTVATNALLENKGVSTGLLITRGFRAVYEARGWTRPDPVSLIDPFYTKAPLLAPQRFTAEVDERLDHEGVVRKPLDESQLRESVRHLRDQGVKAIAVCYLFSFLNPEHEQRTAEIIAEEAPEVRVSLSSAILPLIREYPRLSTTVVDAYIGPVVEHYLLSLARRLKERGVNTPQVYLMQSNGGLMRITVGARFPNQTLLSGPAGGVVAGLRLAERAGTGNLVTFDVGGTSTDICVIAGGLAQQTSEGVLGGQHVGTPMLQVRTLGAGGGTLAYVGKDGLLKVGPASAGAVPGPACYGRGGDRPTITDANLLVGVLGAGSLLDGRMQLDVEAAKRSMEEVGRVLGLSPLHTAAGILRIVNNHMAIDLRLALQERGQDPRRFSLVPFGGAGPMHACWLARALGIPRVIVPGHPGLNSALGLLQTEVKHTYVRSAPGLLDEFQVEKMNSVMEELGVQAHADAREEGFQPEEVELRYQLDLRYLHQGYELTVDCPNVPVRQEHKAGIKQDFDALHASLYGQSAPDEPAEIVTFRLQASIKVPRLTEQDIKAGGDITGAFKGERNVFDIDSGKSVMAAVYDRSGLGAGDSISGPCVIEQFDSTTWVLEGQHLTVDASGALVIDTEVMK